MNELFYYAESLIKITQIMQGVPSYQLGNRLETRLGRVLISHTLYSFLFCIPFSVEVTPSPVGAYSMVTCPEFHVCCRLG